MAPKMHPFNSYTSQFQYQPVSFYQKQPQTNFKSQPILRPNNELDRFESVQETQFYSQPQPQTNFQSQSNRLLDELTDSFDKAPVEESFQEPEVGLKWKKGRKKEGRMPRMDG